MLSGVLGSCCPVCTVGSTLLGILVALPSFVGALMGGICMMRVRGRPQELTGRGIGLAALILGIVAFVLALATIILPWFGFACMSAAGSAGQY